MAIPWLTLLLLILLLLLPLLFLTAGTACTIIIVITLSSQRRFLREHFVLHLVAICRRSLDLFVQVGESDYVLEGLDVQIVLGENVDELLKVGNAKERLTYTFKHTQMYSAAHTAPHFF